MSRHGRAYIGTSGWNYPHWRADFYAGVSPREWLAFCANHFNAVEVNATFYRLQARETFEKWAAQTPEHFRFSIKGNRYLTHNKKLKDPEGPIQKEKEQADALGDKLAAVVWQLPGNFKKRLDRLEAFASALGTWSGVRHALEFRHSSWFDDEVADCLRAHRLGVCQSDAADWPLWGAVTTDMVYVRLHGHTRTYASAYSGSALHRWARQVRGWLAEGRDVHVYFDNDAEGAAPRDALRLMDHLKLR